MNTGRKILAACAASLALAVVGAAAAIEVDDLDDFKAHFGRYAPAGDCKRQPQIVVERGGFVFESGGGIVDRATHPEYAASYGGNYYEGVSLWFFPYFTVDGPNPLLLTFNADEKPGVLAVQAHDHDYPGGPRLPAKWRPFVDASPYRKCR